MCIYITLLVPSVLVRLFEHEVGLSCTKNEKFGYGVAVFQGVTNIAINSELVGL